MKLGGWVSEGRRKTSDREDEWQQEIDHGREGLMRGKDEEFEDGAENCWHAKLRADVAFEKKSYL